MARKGENIYKRKDGRWEARYARGCTIAGKIKYGYCYAKTYREVKEKLAAAKAALSTGTAVSSSNTKRRFSKYCDEWLTINRNKVKESTHVKYLSMLEKHVKPKLGGYYAESLNSIVIEQFAHNLLYENGLSPKTVRDILTMLHAILKYTARQLPMMPQIEIIYPKEVKKEMRVLSKEEQERFTHYLLSNMDECKFGIQLALMTGLRIGEICALRWSDVCLKEKVIRVRYTMQRIKNIDTNSEEKTKVIITEPKSGSSIRIIPLTDYVIDFCRRWEAKNSAAYILTGKIDQYMEPRCLQYKLKQYTKDCGLAGVHFHTLRHTFATRCVEVDFELKSLSEILGHSSPTVTLERYVHTSLELKRNNMNKLPAFGF